MTSNDSDQTDQTVVIGHYSHVVEAELARTFLESHGIKASLQDQYTINMNWLYSGALGGVKVRVPLSQEADARQLLEDVENNKFALQDSEVQELPCPQCKSTETERRRPQSKGLAMLILYFAYLPLPFLSREKYECRSCGHQWTIKDPSSLGYMLIAFALIGGLVWAVMLLLDNMKAAQ